MINSKIKPVLKGLSRVFNIVLFIVEEVKENAFWKN